MVPAFPQAPGSKNLIDLHEWMIEQVIQPQQQNIAGPPALLRI